ncbi:MAG: hypothetical protein WC728_16475 [Elusimicrobiota bacterium]
MDRASLILILAVAPCCAQDRGARPLSRSLRESLVHVTREMSATETGRRLLAVTSEMPVLELPRQPGAPVRFASSPEPSLVVDGARAGALTSLDFEVLFVRARVLAAARIPVDLADAELLAHQTVLEYALDKAAVDPAFLDSLRRATSQARERVESRRKLGVRAPELFPGPRPEGTLARVAFDLFVFSEDPYLFYEAVLASAEPSSERVSLSELEDFLALHGGRLDAVRFVATGRLALAGEGMYPGRVARAALAVRDAEGLSRLREGLGLFRTSGREALTKRVNRWIREGKP